ncbi:MAG: sulfotransferase family protein [Pyrinomonadaceae bacterium]
MEQKVFGLGLSKTGTSSLVEALNLLGIKSVHYPHDERTYSELRSGNYRLSFLDEYQGAADIPVAPFYAQLDREFPGSKFILTTREQEAWLRSCEMHWRLMREWRENFPRFNRFHEFIGACVYGTIEFNRDRFAYVYDLHARNVCDYFKDRGDDFLVMDICAGEGWDKLCAFLKCDTPNESFPRANEWMHLLMRAAEDVARVVPEGESFILVDGQGFGSDFAQGRRQIPFLEQNGEYWGAPADDRTAINELERLRAGRASHLVIGFPSFWWLNYYAEFAAYLLDRFPCLVKNDSVVIFDLRA